MSKANELKMKLKKYVPHKTYVCTVHTGNISIVYKHALLILQTQIQVTNFTYTHHTHITGFIYTHT